MGNKESKPLVYRRDSFDCRVTDYLCEILLSYLSFEDKIRFECISKQFKGLVFNKQYVLNQTYYDINGLPQLWPQRQSDNPNLIAIERLLMKCKAINSIECQVMTTDLAKVLVKYCNHLKTFNTGLHRIDIEVLNSFGEKFGQSLTEIGFRNMFGFVKHQSLENSLIEFCPKLIHINRIQFNHFVVQNNFKHFENLTEIVISINNFSDIYLFDLFVNNYKKQLKSLTIKYHIIDIEVNDIFISHSINFLKSIATEFTELGEFGFHMFGIIDDQNMDELLIAISGMVNIKKLDLILFKDISPQTLQHLYSMKWLTKLRFAMLGVTDDFFTDIQNHFPKLKTLTLYESGIHITNNVLKSLSKLKSLKTIVLSVGDKGLDLSDEDFIQFINDCKSVKNIAIQSKQEISGEIIEAMISLALRKPELKFKWKLKFGKNLQKYKKNVPKNASFDSHQNFIVII